MEADELIAAIESAFNGTKRPEISLRQFRLTAQKGMSGELTHDEWLEAGRARVDSIWQDIPDSEIDECDCVLAHMDANEFQYYLPAYMRYSVKHFRKPIWESNTLGSTVFSLYPSKRSSDLYHYTVLQLSLLNLTQRSAIVRFLNFVAMNADFVQRPDAIKALERYWNDNVRI